MRTLALLTSGLCVFAISAHAAGNTVQSSNEKNPVEAAADGDWITLNGKVTSSSGTNFQLDYGGGTITVEMDDYDWYNENVLKAGERVTVTGRVDDNFLASKTLEASSVYVDQRNTHYFANAADEEGGFYSFYGVYSVPAANNFAAARDGDWIGLTGKIRALDRDTLNLDTGSRTIKVDLDDVPYAVTAQIGDRVRVYGEVDDADLFEGAELEATSVAVLERN